MAEGTPVLVWFRNDLRVTEHAPLSAALASGRPVKALYILADGQWDQHGVAPVRRWYVLESLRELGETLASSGVSLDILPVPSFAAIPQALDTWLATNPVSRIYTGREYPLNEVNRDREVARLAAQHGITIEGFDHGVMVPPRALMTGQGTPYTVFTPYRRSWDRWLAEHGPLPMPNQSRPAKRVRFTGHQIIDQALAKLDVPAEQTQWWQPGERAARAQLQRFADQHLAHYQRDRDFPDLAATSMLSTALSAGTLSVAECWHVARQAQLDPAAREGVRCWVGELAWRDFYRQIVANYPRLCRGEPFREDTSLIRWSDNEAGFQAWCEGRTGYPLVDAAQRQLLQTGWMHNRLRMVSAMFLTKHLFIDWRRGEDFFMRHLIDGDFAANNGGWQWSASTGTDAAPYFRVFSPIRQSERFDAQGQFIRRFVPELAGLNDKQIHQPWKYHALVPDYPLPVVEHAGVKERVTAAFRAARELVE
jgi:deoxyribodipyrimidine photo-lyase